MNLFEDDWEIRGLTLWRPWPDAIFNAGKRLENRPWPTPMNLIGCIIAIHAGLKYDDDGAKWMEERGLYRPRVMQDCPAGRIVGTAIVTGYIIKSEDPWFIGPYGWHLEDVREFEEPLACGGSQRLWKLRNYNLEQEVRRRMKTARRAA